ncbi:Tetratricopeptide, SHNi-TPR domain [Phytophthora cactorum]|nr:Tetratricopeptide, SHNi-TPR domain [Phytophthora cactorum]
MHSSVASRTRWRSRNEHIQRDAEQGDPSPDVEDPGDTERPPLARVRPNKFHFTMNNDELVFAAITAKDYPSGWLSNDLGGATEIVPKIRIQGTDLSRGGLSGLDKDCAKAFCSYRYRYDDRTKVDKLSEVMHQVDGVKTVMHNNIQVFVQYGEDGGRGAEDQRPEEQAKVFRNTGRKLRRQMLNSSRVLIGAKSSFTMATETAQELEKTLQTLATCAACRFLRNKRLEEACEVEGKSDSLAVAPVYYEYGHALLSLTEVTASLFGGAVEGAAASGGGDGEKDAREAADDLEAAWEVMELARVIYSRYPGDQASIQRLGDLGLESDQFEQAKADFEKALLLRRKLLKATKAEDTTQLADLYCQLAIASDKETEVVPNEELTQLVMAGRVMAENIHRVAKKCGDKLPKFAERIPAYSLEGETEPKGKGKRKAPSKHPETMKEEFLKVVGVKEDDKDKMKEDEKTLLEYMEIYLELKEKESKEEKAVTTIGFGQTDSSTAPP